MRYEAFLKGKRKFIGVSKREIKTCPKCLLTFAWILSPSEGSDYEQMTEWERSKEKEEFARTARLFQPLSTSLSEKFTSGTSETEDQVSTCSGCCLFVVNYVPCSSATFVIAHQRHVSQKVKVTHQALRAH